MTGPMPNLTGPKVPQIRVAMMPPMTKEETERAARDFDSLMQSIPAHLVAVAQVMAEKSGAPDSVRPAFVGILLAAMGHGYVCRQMIERREDAEPKIVTGG